MTTNQEGVHAAVRAETGTSGSYLADWHALFDADAIAAGPWGPRLLAWINQTLGTSYTNTPEAMQAFAIDQGFARWNDMNTLGAAPNSTEAQQFYDRLLTPPVGARETLYNSLIDGLVADGVWTKLDALYIFAAADEATALTNLVQADYAAERYTTATDQTFTADDGWTGGSFLIKINSTFNPSTAVGAKYVQNSAHVSCWRASNVQEDRNTIGAVTTAGSATRVLPRWSDTNTYWRVNSGSDEVSANVAANGGGGFMLAQRTGAGALALYQNGSSIATGSTASTSPMNEEICFAACNGLVTCASIGAHMSTGEVSAFYSRLQTYLSGVGAI
jgi:hypothetical protein